MLSWNQMNGFSLPYNQMAPYQMSMPTIPGPKVIYDNNFIPQGISVPISAPFQLLAVADQIKVDDLKDRIKVKLVEEDLWERFKNVQNEMIITKAGRNPLPKLYFNVEGLEPENCYLFSMAFRRVGNEKYVFLSSSFSAVFN
uniref:T-box domain-containing protein n=1 Tax=Panagrolaimus davidi TaxID=227884 RepID=A0A914PJB8_9BILA